ncbi:MAG: type II toxin-antitoxin system VapC family toxin [Flavobacteriaceae bacterium]|nr:type II toxin-antitoxin system VapC family toxin [Flavobacteriaceae bacterium]
MDKIVVPDSNIFAKLLFQEGDSYVAKGFFEYCVINNITLVVPELFIYEIMSITQYYKGDMKKSISHIEAHKGVNLIISSPSLAMWQTAQKISNAGHSKSGYPSMYDSIYHALAIEGKGTFITADKRHFSKTENQGHICLLENWKSLF